MSTLLQDIEAQISGLKTGVTKQNVGTVREIGDGVAKIEGLSDAMLNEMLDFGNGVIGLALNLEETEVGAIILVGGNIRGQTRTMTTAIAMQTSQGYLPLALGLGAVLVGLSIAVSGTVFSLAGSAREAGQDEGR